VVIRPLPYPDADRLVFVWNTYPLMGLPQATVTPSFFTTFRRQPFLGRVFSEAEATPGADRVAVLTYGLWNSRFGADPSLVGRTVRLNGEEYAVVGVMPADFELPAREGFHPGALRVHAAADVRPGAGQRVQRDGRETAA
jgi:hypothetical protein